MSKDVAAHPPYRPPPSEKASIPCCSIQYEGVSPGFAQTDTAVPQAYYNAQEGTKRLTTETGAGQWGSALAFACAQFGLGCEVWQVAASYQQKPYRRTLMEVFGATVHSSPSELTNAGRTILAGDPNSTAVSELLSPKREVAAAIPTRNTLWEASSSMCCDQTVIGGGGPSNSIGLGRRRFVVGCTGAVNFGGSRFHSAGEDGGRWHRHPCVDQPHRRRYQGV